MFDKEVASLFCKIVKEEKWAKVLSVTEKMMSKSPPPGLKTVELLRAASAGLHIGPHTAMVVAERLYTKVGMVRVFYIPCSEGSPYLRLSSMLDPLTHSLVERCLLHMVVLCGSVTWCHVMSCDPPPFYSRA